MAKERIGIEYLLQRAYREWRVDRVTPKTVLGIERPRALRAAGLGLSTLGTRVDVGNSMARAAAAQREALSIPEDFADLHEMVLSLPDVFAWFGGDGLQLWTQEDAQDAGGAISRADGHNAWTLTLPDEAPRRVRLIVTSTLVGEHARQATRPDWRAEGTKVRPYSMNRHGRADVWEEDGRKFCPIVFEPLPSQLWEARGQYVVWWDALRLLSAQRFDRYEASVPTVPRRPWAESVRVIHSDCVMREGRHRLSR